MRAHIRAPVVQLFLQLVLDDLALFFHHQDLLQTHGKVTRDRSLQRPDHVHLVQADAQQAAGVVIQAQVDQRLACVVERLAAGDDAKAVLPGFDHVVVELVGADIRQRRIPLVIHQARFLLQGRIGPANVQAAGRHHKIVGRDDVHAVRVDRNAGRGLDDLLDRLHARPHACKAAERKCVQPHIQNVLHAGGKEHR
ncbi:hypothetical protein D3C72_1579040 [compost metagenome]